MSEGAGPVAGRCACGAEIARTHAYSWCTACGEPLPADLKAQLDNPYTRHAAESEHTAPARAEPVQDHRFAGFWIRALARAIDSLLGFIVNFAAAIIAVIVLSAAGAPGTIDEWLASIESWSAASLLSSLAGTTLYFVMSEWVGGASAGKLVCGLRVRSEDLGAVTLKSAFIRSAAFVIDALFFGLIVASRMSSSPQRQRLGDAWGRTVVVHRAKIDGLAPGWGRAIAGIVLGAAIMTGFDVHSIARRVMNDPRISTQPTSFALQAAERSSR